MPRAVRMVPVVCSDREVQRFVAEEMLSIGPYSNAKCTMTASQLFQAARDRFGDRRCLDLELALH